MHFSSTATTLIVFTFTAIATADLHYSGLCIDKIGGQNVYNDVATRAACGNYQVRNTGGKQWDTCPDCTMVCATLEIPSTSWKLTVYSKTREALTTATRKLST